MDNKLNILWTSDNEQTAINMVEMYSKNALKRGWFESVSIIIWGGVNTLIKDSKKVQTALTNMIDAGIELKACKACATEIGTVSILESLGVEVDYMGVPLTAVIKNTDEYFLSV